MGDRVARPLEPKGTKGRLVIGCSHRKYFQNDYPQENQHIVEERECSHFPLELGSDRNVVLILTRVPAWPQRWWEGAVSTGPGSHESGEHMSLRVSTCEQAIREEGVRV